jgi:predicted TPR repeat methyltransferase
VVAKNKTKESNNEKSVEDVNQEFYGEHFNEDTVEYLKKISGARWFNDLLVMTLKHVNKKSIKTVADVGCGVGHKTLTLKKQLPSADVTGFDFSESAIEAGKKAYGPEGVKYSCEDITKKNYKKTYDLISAFDVLEHIDDWEGMVEKLIAINNKYLLFSFPVGRMRPYEKNIGHFRNFQRNQMEDFLAKHGYVTVHTFYAGFPFFSPILRDLTQLFSKNYSETISSKMSPLGVIIHKVWYLLFRYGSMKNHGDVFIGLFEKQITPKKHVRH